MQNSIVAGLSSSPIIRAGFSSAPTNLHGWQWKEQECGRDFGAPRPISLCESRSGDRRSAGFVVTAFFGGSKSPPVKSAGKGCFSCLGKGAVDCAGCKGSGKNKKNGNMFERWKCYDCQGFGMVSCPKCGTGGLTPEQRGER